MPITQRSIISNIFLTGWVFENISTIGPNAHNDQAGSQIAIAQFTI